AERASPNRADTLAHFGTLFWPRAAFLNRQPRNVQGPAPGPPPAPRESYKTRLPKRQARNVHCGALRDGIANDVSSSRRTCARRLGRRPLRRVMVELRDERQKQRRSAVIARLHHAMPPNVAEILESNS